MVIIGKQKKDSHARNDLVNDAAARSVLLQIQAGGHQIGSHTVREYNLLVSLNIWI